MYSDTFDRSDNNLHHDVVSELNLLSNLTFYRITKISNRTKYKYEGENVRHVGIFTMHIRCNQCPCVGNHMTLLNLRRLRSDKCIAFYMKDSHVCFITQMHG